LLYEVAETLLRTGKESTLVFLLYLLGGGGQRQWDDDFGGGGGGGGGHLLTVLPLKVLKRKHTFHVLPSLPAILLHKRNRKKPNL
jgi:hypothetical protein